MTRPTISLKLKNTENMNEFYIYCFIHDVLRNFLINLLTNRSSSVFNIYVFADDNVLISQGHGRTGEFKGE